MTLTVRNEFSEDTAVSSLIVAIPARAGFTHNRPLALGQTAAFTNTSTGTNLAYLWDFGDGTTSTEANPTHQFTAPGTYRVTLTVSNELGMDTAVSSIEVRAMVYLPVAIRP